MILTVFFDIGDVLVDVKSLIRSASYDAAGACHRIRNSYSDSLLAETYIEVDRGIHHEHMNHLFGDRIIADTAIHQVTGKHDDRLVASFLTAYRSRIRKEIRPTDEMTLFFNSFANNKSTTIDFGVISDGTTDEQLETLVRLDIIQYFRPDLLVISESFGQEKTNTAIFQEAIRRCGTRPQQIVMIGDNLDRDIKNAAIVGMIPIYFDRYVAAGVAPLSQPMFAYRANSFEKLANIITMIYHDQ